MRMVHRVVWIVGKQSHQVVKPVGAGVLTISSATTSYMVKQVARDKVVALPPSYMHVASPQSLRPRGSADSRVGSQLILAGVEVAVAQERQRSAAVGVVLE